MLKIEAGKEKMRQEWVTVNNNDVKDAGRSFENANAFYADSGFGAGSAQRAESINISQLCKQEPKLKCRLPKKKWGSLLEYIKKTMG